MALTFALAAPPALASGPPASAEPSAAELFREGQAEAAAADYEGAIEKFEAAMKQVAHDPEAVGIRNRMRTELVIAHLRAHAVDDDAAHLNKASLLLDDYEHDLEPGQTEEREWAAQRRAEIETRREEIRVAEAAAAEQARAAEAARAPEANEPEPTPVPATAPAPAPTTDAATDPGGARTLMVTGGVVTGVGVVGGVLAVAGFAMASAAVDTFENKPDRRDDARSQNRTGNAMGIAGGVVAGIAIPTGVALLVVGARRRGAARTAVVPYAAPGAGGAAQAGLSVGGRF